MKKKFEDPKEPDSKKENQDLQNQKELQKSSRNFKPWFYNLGMKS